MLLLLLLARFKSNNARVFAGDEMRREADAWQLVVN
jgi:hypothetical protein